jgi:hypothetical protein
MDPRLRELVALSALAALACGLAATQNELLFVAPFGAASVVAIVEAIRRLR